MSDAHVNVGTLRKVRAGQYEIWYGRVWLKVLEGAQYFNLSNGLFYKVGKDGEVMCGLASWGTSKYTDEVLQRIVRQPQWLHIHIVEPPVTSTPRAKVEAPQTQSVCAGIRHSDEPGIDKWVDEQRMQANAVAFFSPKTPNKPPIKGLLLDMPIGARQRWGA